MLSGCRMERCRILAYRDQTLHNRKDQSMKSKRRVYDPKNCPPRTQCGPDCQEYLSLYIPTSALICKQFRLPQHLKFKSLKKSDSQTNVYQNKNIRSKALKCINVLEQKTSVLKSHKQRIPLGPSPGQQ